jgi:hypothetical protein
MPNAEMRGQSYSGMLIPGQGLADWIGAHTGAFEAIGGVAHLIVPDNTKRR